VKLTFDFEPLGAAKNEEKREYSYIIFMTRLFQA